MVEYNPGSSSPTLKIDLIRVAAGLVFVISGLVILLVAIRLPDSFFGAVFKMALFPFYAQLIRFVVLTRAILFAWLLVGYQIVTGVCILAKGKIVLVGLAGFLVFLLISLPALGLYSLINLPLIILLAMLLRKRYDRTILDLFRGAFVKVRPRQSGGM